MRASVEDWWNGSFCSERGIRHGEEKCQGTPCITGNPWAVCKSHFEGAALPKLDLYGMAQDPKSSRRQRRNRTATGTKLMMSQKELCGGTHGLASTPSVVQQKCNETESESGSAV